MRIGAAATSPGVPGRRSPLLRTPAALHSFSERFEFDIFESYGLRCLD